MKLKHALTGALITMGLAPFAAAEPATTAPLFPLEEFSALPQVSNVRLSPDGKFLAYITPVNGRLHVAMHAVGETDPSKMKLLPPLDKDGTTADVSWVRWGNNDHLLVAYRFTGQTRVSYKQTGNLASADKFQAISFSVLFSVPRNGEVEFIDMTQVKPWQRTAGMKTSPAQFKDDVIDYLPDEPNHFLQAVDTDRDGRYEIRKVDIRNGDFKEITPGEPGIQNWMVDRGHEARIGWGYSRSKFKMIYRNPDTGKFVDVTDAEWQQSDTIHILDVAEDPHFVYALENTEETTRRLVLFDMVAGKVKEVVFEPEDGTVTGLSHHPKTGAVIGYDYEDDKGSHTHYSEPFFAKMSAQIDRLLPNGENSIVGAVPDEGLYTILHSSNTDEGTFYLLNLKAKSLSPILQKRAFKAQDMAITTGEWIETRDGLKIETLVTRPVGMEDAKNAPVVVMPHGGPQSHSDYSFDYMRQFLANRGYVIIEPNFRGSTGYGRTFKEAGYNQWGAKMQDDVTDATQWAIDTGLADPKRICIAGGSYGGYSALMGTIRAQGMYQCAISLNGVTDIQDMLRNDRHFMGGTNWNKKIIPEGLGADDISPTDLASEVSAPVLIIHAKDDPRVPYQQGEDMYRKLKGLNKPVELVSIESGDHFLDTAEARYVTLNAMEAFLARHIGGAR